jgi:hypothetical protein
MKSGLWILFVVLVAAVAVGILLRPRLTRLMEEQEPPEVAELDEIEGIEDPKVKVERLKGFLAEYQGSETRYRAHRQLALTMVSALKDTTGYLEFAESALAGEDDSESRAEIYYRLYSLQAASDSETALRIADRLLDEAIDVGWIYNYIGYDLAERGIGLDTAVGLCNKALGYAESGMDSANVMDSRGWAYYKRGDYNRAVADLEIAAELFDPPYEEILRHLAYAALGAGRDDKAFETLKTILIMGEYDYARTRLDSIMDVRGYSSDQRAGFEESVWQARMEAAVPGEAFILPTLAGDAYEFDPTDGAVAVINFMSPT